MNQFYVQPAQFGQGLQSLAQGAGQFRQEQEVKAEKQQATQRQQEAREAMQQAVDSGDPRMMQNVMVQFPEVQEQAKAAFGFTNEATEKVAREGYARAASTKDPEQAAQILEQTASQIQQLGGRPVMTSADAQALRQDPEGAMKRIRSGFAMLASPQEFAAVMGEDAMIGQDASTRAFEARAAAAGLQPGTPEYERAAQIELGMVPRAGISAQERIALDPNMTQQVAASGAQIEGAKAGSRESAQLAEQLEMKPRIQRAVKEAEQAAASRGESLSELNRAEAALPGIREVVNKLTTLADVATYTEGGKAFDQIVKQLGFGSTGGATARAQMLSIVDNQVLPLLRDTFGAAFTEKEGERLTKTLMDPDATPETKKAQLNSFIEQKMRDIETKRRVAGEAAEPAADLSIEDLINQYGG